MPGNRISNFFHPCYKLLPAFYFLYSFMQKKAAGFSAFPAALCMPYSFFGSHTAVTRLLHLGHFVVISTFPGESVPMSSRRPPHLGHRSCSIGYSSFSGIIFHPPLAVYAEREPVNKSRSPFLLSPRGEGVLPQCPSLQSPRHTAALPATACRFHLPLSSHSESYVFRLYVWVSASVQFPPFRISTVPRFPRQLSWNRIYAGP